MRPTLHTAVLAAALAAAWLAGCDGGLGGGGQPTHTVLLITFTGAGHVRDSKYYLEQTRKCAGWDGLYIVHRANDSMLYWGKYYSIDAAADALRTAKGWQAPNGYRLYGRATIVPLPGEDIGPPEWNLGNAKGAYTVVVAYFYNKQGQGLVPAYRTSREDAVKTCGALREMGEEAYFYHTPGRSYVTIGNFGPEAMKGVREEVRGPDGQVLLGSDGGPQWSMRLEVADPEIKRIMSDYKALLVNGATAWTLTTTDPQTGEKKRSALETSYVWEIPDNRRPAGGEAPLDHTGDGEPG